MLAGEPPFTGSNPGALLARKLTDTALDVSTVRETVPWPVAQALRRALSRTPADRFQTAADFARSLDHRAEAAMIAGAQAADAEAGTRAAAPRRQWGLALASMAVGALAMAAVATVLRSGEDRTPAVALSVPLGALEFAEGLWPSLDISPDGSHIAYLARDSVDRRLYLKPLAGVARPVIRHLP